ncbi:GIY-YIG endonuclease (mitochondrion) [Hirsutella rhossiliensis]|uniref:GIY-YIG endonuclease n=1 Tax=Hirsutella rhossiliensis TaxID=111463 RepID=A0A164LW95_9HYPO|nr:GIY-YIG endonuclease [Hirsutella rhossiliensis]AMO02239.1 GIY-YIG endonuclease [Hirsutella rhossiliensis]AYU58460.1 GIY-YIG endonuclease [Hirsutella rhossiliensis]KAH0956886.1 GIY-YIG endonuclease [Hirsutella rhossiliensis]
MKKRYYTTGITPAITYKNCDQNKIQILNDNRNKGGIYCWINNINNKIYVGSSINLTNRFYKYYSIKHLTLRKTPIHNALLKYGYSNFTLILEYITDKEQVIKREQYYLDFLKPQYNILAKANSFLGYKHTEETLKFFREGRILNEEARNKLSIAACFAKEEYYHK